MVIVETVFYLVAYDVYVLSGLFAAVWIFGAINWLRNPYRRQNKKMDDCRNKVVGNPKFAWLYVASLPQEYCRQWRAYVNSGAARPSLVFEFVPKKKRLVALPVFIWCALLSSCYVVLFALDTTHREYLVFQAAFWLAFALVVLVNRTLLCKKERRARQTFGKFVCQLNAVKDVAQSEDAGKLAKRLTELNKQESGKTALEKASALLRENGLEGNRTAEQQRQINRALNGLLQAYSRRAAQTAHT